VVASVIALVLLVSMLVYGCSTRDVDGTVTERNWTRAVTVLNWGMVTRTGWREHDGLVETTHRDPPGESSGIERIRSCSRDVRTHRQVATGSHVVCTTASIWSLIAHPALAQSYGNGFGAAPSGGSGGAYSAPSYSAPAYTPTTTCNSVTDYTSVPVYDDHCTYDTWTWADGPTTSSHGSGSDSPQWPKVVLTALQKTRNAESYVISWVYVDGEERVEAREVSNADYDAWPMNAVALVTVNNFGSVRAIEHTVTR
jgi:hypothetical protein